METTTVTNEPQLSDKRGKVVPTYTINIYIGLQAGYNGKIYTIEDVMACCQAYCDRVGFAVSVTETTFVYTRGREPGAVIGLINYPQFPSEPPVVQHHAKELCEILMDTFHQQRATMVASGCIDFKQNVTVMMEQPWASELVV